MSVSSPVLKPSDQESLLPLVYRPPASWPVDHKLRRFIGLPERQFTEENDLKMMRRSVRFLLGRKDERGSFHTDGEYRQGDRVDDQLGACSMISYLLFRDGPDPILLKALESGVRFHLDHLVLRTSSQPFPYSRFFLDYDSALDLGNSVWELWGGALVLRYGLSFLSENTGSELRELMDQTWQLISTSPLRGENPCHNQLLEFCEIGILYAHAIGNKEIVAEVLEYYHQRLRPLRVLDRGHLIYTEYNQWDANYGLLSWMALEHLYASTGDPAFAEDADAMAQYFNEMVSAGGFYWGGPRYNEGGLEEFIHLPASRAKEMELDRLLIPEPADAWDRLVLDGHYGRVLLLRMTTKIRVPSKSRPQPPTPWSFRHEKTSVCLQQDAKLHHLSAAGFEIIPTASALGHGCGLVWQENGRWKRDHLQLHPPASSEGESYNTSTPIQLPFAKGVAAMQRGSTWETRQWWIGSGKSLLWFGHVICHTFPVCEKIDFVLGNPILTRLDGVPVSVTEVEAAEGGKVETQGDATSLLTQRHLRFGDVVMAATVPLEFVRPDRDAFHTFPLSKRIYLHDCASSNELRLRLSENSGRVPCRESLFFAIEISNEVPKLFAERNDNSWVVKSALGTLTALISNNIWTYELDRNGDQHILPRNSFGFDPDFRKTTS